MGADAHQAAGQAAHGVAAGFSAEVEHGGAVAGEAGGARCRHEVADQA
jgi:hypothetical protein